MTHRSNQKYSSSVASFVVMLVPFVAVAALAQMAAASRVPAEHTAVYFGTQRVAAAQLVEQHSRSAAARGPAPAILSEKNPRDASPSDANPLIFLPAVTYDAGGYTSTAVAVGDLNGDGKLDVVVGSECVNSGCSSGGAGVGVMLGNGDGTFQPAVTYSTGGGSGPFWPVSIAIADVNGDHKPDLVVANGGSNSVGILLGNGDGTFKPAATFGSGGMYPVFVAVGDVNGDGKPDVVVANECADANCDGSVGVLLGNGNGTFQPAVAYGAGGLYALSVAIADVNGDGKPDLVLATNYMVCSKNACSPTGSVGVLLGHGDGTFEPAVIYDAGGRYPYSLAVADLNGDGKLDVVTANSWSGTAGVLMGSGDGTLQAAVAYSCGGAFPQINSIAVADVNQDSHPDILISSEDSSTVCALLGNGDGSFEPAVAYGSGGAFASGVAVGDVNGDGRPDLLVSNQCIVNSSQCGGPVSKTRGIVGVLLNNFGAPQTTTSLVSSANPAAVNRSITYTATVTFQSGRLANGTVTFEDGGSAVASVPLSGSQASYTTSYAKKGTHSITASYSGELNRAAGSNSNVVEEVIEFPHPTSTVVTTSGSPSFVGQPVELTATVSSSSGPIPDGELVAFYDGATSLASVALVAGKATYTTSTLKVATHKIKVNYPGDATFNPSSGTVAQIVALYPTTTTLTTRPNPSNYGQSVTLTAQVKITSSTSPTGTMLFKNGTTSVGAASVNASGVATVTNKTLPVGTNSLTATYNGDAANGKSTSSAVAQTVNQAHIAMRLGSSQNPSKQGQAVKFTATLTSNGGLPNGQTVTFSYNGNSLGTGTITGGKAVLVTTTLPVGSDVVTATYAGDADYSSAKASVKQVVN